MEPSVVEQADARTVAVCGGAGALGADGQGVARTCDRHACSSDKRKSELAPCACDTRGLSSEDAYRAQARKHGPVNSITRYFCNEETSTGTGHEASHPEVKESMHQKRCLLFHCTERNSVATIRARAACVS